MMLLCWLRNVVNSVFAFEEIVIWSPFDHVIASMSITLMLSGLNSCTVIMYINRLLVKENKEWDYQMYSLKAVYIYMLLI